MVQKSLKTPLRNIKMAPYQIKRAIFVTLFAVFFFFCLHIMYNEIQFHAEEAQNSIMIVLFMPNLADLKNIKRNVLLEKVHTCK